MARAGRRYAAAAPMMHRHGCIDRTAFQPPNPCVSERRSPAPQHRPSRSGQAEQAKPNRSSRTGQADQAKPIRPSRSEVRSLASVSTAARAIPICSVSSRSSIVIRLVKMTACLSEERPSFAGLAPRKWPQVFLGCGAKQSPCLSVFGLTHGAGTSVKGESLLHRTDRYQAGSSMGRTRRRNT
jgi:hypothetical protein